MWSTPIRSRCTPSSAAAGTRVDQVEFFQSLPEIIRFGGRFRRTPDLELRLFGGRVNNLIVRCRVYHDRLLGKAVKEFPSTC